MDFYRFWNPFSVNFWSKLVCENDEKTLCFIAFSRFRRFKNQSKNRCGKKGVKMVVRGTSCSTEGILNFINLARRNPRQPRGLSFQKIPSEENREESQQKGANKVECKRNIQKDKCRQGTHNARKHARWPAATCGFNRLRAIRLARV